jgi:hypothetical protein
MSTTTSIETINGFVVIAERPTPLGDERLILAARPDAYSPSGFEYVTARTTPRETNPTSWYWGHYLRDLPEALEDLEERSNAR